MPGELVQLFKTVIESGIAITSDAERIIVVPFDDSAVDRVSKLDFGDKQANIRALEVENLLNIAASRINSCLTLRERAQEIQVRALCDAVEIHIQESATTLQTEIDNLTAPAAQPIAENDLKQKRAALNELMLLRPALLKARAQEPGHGSNYGERYEFLRKMFQSVFEDAYVRCKVIATALKSIYGIDHPLPKLRATGFLDDLTFWVQTASDKLELVLEGRKRLKVAISLGSPDATATMHPLTSNDFAAQRAAGIFSFDLKAVFDKYKIKEPRVRSIFIQLLPKDGTFLGRFYSAQLTAPGNALVMGDNTVPLTALAGDVSSCAAFITSEFHNIDPTSGSWTLKMGSQPVFGPVDPVDVVSHIVLHFDISAVR